MDHFSHPSFFPGNVLTAKLRQTVKKSNPRADCDAPMHTSNFLG